VVIIGNTAGSVGERKVGDVAARLQWTQSLLLPSEGFTGINPYLAPNDLYLFWGESASTGTLASGFNGGRGRASSGQRIRQVLNFGDFTGNGWDSPISSARALPPTTAGTKTQS
jgi:hypothetical protein